jgi:hypothetical protein
VGSVRANLQSPARDSIANSALRLYGPLEPWFDKSLAPGRHRGDEMRKPIEGKGDTIMKTTTILAAHGIVLTLSAASTWAQSTPGYNNKIPEEIMTPDTVERHTRTRWSTTLRLSRKPFARAISRPIPTRRPIWSFRCEPRRDEGFPPSMLRCPDRSSAQAFASERAGTVV